MCLYVQVRTATISSLEKRGGGGGAEVDIGLITILRHVGGSRVPNGITSGWDQVRMGSGEPSRVLFYFSALMENIPRNLFIYHMENSAELTALPRVWYVSCVS